MTPLVREFVDMKIDLAMLKTAFGNSIRVGTVEEVDAQKGYRVRLGETAAGEPYLSPWIAHPESGGQSKSWMPLSKGQTVGLLSPTGDMRQAVMLRAGFSGDNAPPSADLLANVLAAFGVTATVKDGTVTIDGNLVVNGNVSFAGGYLHHDGVNVGADHVHGGVISGGADTTAPH